MKKLKNYIKLIRIKHYFKNILIFLPLVFSGELLKLDKLSSAIIGFISFSLISSVVYIINDLKDIESDRLHDVKKNRPLASGKIKPINAIILAVIFLISSVSLNFLIIDVNVINIVGYIMLYLLINIGYSFGLKKKPIVDIVILVAGFLIRVLYGSGINNIELSNWLYLTIIAGSFYMGLGKRRNEILKQGTKSREVLKSYNKEFLNNNMYMCLSLCIVFYSLWSVDPNTISRINSNLLIWTVPILMVILMKYSLNIEGDSQGDPVDVLFGDKILLGLVALLGLCLFSLIYLI